jgi:hypothetical protein
MPFGSARPTLEQIEPKILVEGAPSFELMEGLYCAFVDRPAGDQPSAYVKEMRKTDGVESAGIGMARRRR